MNPNLQIKNQLPLFDLLKPNSDENYNQEKSNGVFSDYIVYVDESGDHNLISIDEKYPIFVLTFCIFHKRYYSENVIPMLEKFKFNYFGHDSVVLHEHEIRKQKGDFVFLSKRDLRECFMLDLTSIIDKSKFIVISAVIDKRNLQKNDSNSRHPYDIALNLCLNSLRDFLQEKNQLNRITHIIFERRGKKEDSELELEFRRLCDHINNVYLISPFIAIFVDKKANASGLQLADLLARPIGIHYLRPKEFNRAFEVLKNKFFCRGGRQKLGEDYEEYGLKIFPLHQKAKSPDEPTEAATPTRNPQSISSDCK